MSQVYVQMTEAEYLEYINMKEEVAKLKSEIIVLKMEQLNDIGRYDTVDLFEYTIKKIMRENRDKSSKGPTFFCDSYENEFANVETEFLPYEGCQYTTKIKIENMLDR